MPRDDATVLDIVLACQCVIEFVGDSSKAQFLTDRKTQAAVMHELLIVGEAVKRLTETFRRDHPKIPWRQIAGMRDRLIHDYDDIDLDEVWKTTVDDVPDLLSYLQPLVRTTPGS